MVKNQKIESSIYLEVWCVTAMRYIVSLYFSLSLSSAEKGHCHRSRSAFLLNNKIYVDFYMMMMMIK